MSAVWEISHSLYSLLKYPLMMVAGDQAWRCLYFLSDQHGHSYMPALTQLSSVSHGSVLLLGDIVWAGVQSMKIQHIKYPRPL